MMDSVRNSEDERYSVASDIDDVATREGPTPSGPPSGSPEESEPSFDDGFDAAFDGDHTIEYWFWNGWRLVPASADEAERFRQREALAREAAMSTREEVRANTSVGRKVNALLLRLSIVGNWLRHREALPAMTDVEDEARHEKRVEQSGYANAAPDASESRVR